MSTRSDATEGTFWGDVDDGVALHRYQTLVNTIDDGLYQLDTEGHFVAVNDVIVETTGYSRDDLLGEHVSLILTDRDVDRIEREIGSRIGMKDMGIATFELGIQTAEGGVVPCELRINVLIEAGEFQGTIGVARDLSEKKQRLASLESAQASVDSITSILDEANIGVFVLDDEFTIAWADETVGEYLDLDCDELIGRDKRTVLDETIKHRFADPDRFAEKVRATYEENRQFETFECRVTGGESRDGRWLEHQSKPIESGQYAGGRIELYYDVTDRKRSEDAHRESEERFRSLVDAVEEYAIFRLDRDGHVVSWNDGASQIKGYDRDEILGEHFSTFYTEDDRAAGVPTQNLERAAENGSIEDEGWRVRKDGSKFWANVTITAVRDDDGTHRGYLKVTRDMTDRHRREQELEHELQRVFGRISDAFYAVDEECRFTHVNERAEQLLETSEEELVGEPIWDAFSTIDRMEDIRDAFETAMNSQEATSLEFYNDNLDFWVEANLYPSETGISVYFRDVTDRKEREQELEQYEQTIETVWDGVATLDADDRFMMVNDAFCEMTGYERDQLIGQRVTHVHDETVNAEAEELEEDVLAGEKDYASLEFKLETADGETIPVEARFGPYELEDGSFGRTGVIRDISERKERERELMKYETVVETSPVGITIVDSDGELQFANGRAEEIFGRSKTQISNLSFDDPEWDEVAEDGEPISRDELPFPRIMESEEPLFDQISGVLRPDGERVWISVNGVPVYDDRGEIDSVVFAIEDITERREQKRALEESERRYRTLVENFPNGAVGLYDEDFVYSIAGGSLLDDLGHSPDDVVDTTIYSRYPDDLVEEIKPYFRAVFDGESNAFEIDLNGRDLLAHTLPVRNADDEIYAGMVVVQDVTERKEYRRQLEESNERLEQFAYAVSHDLQEPLRMVTSYLQLIDQRYGDALDDDGEEFLEFAVDGAERMRQMIDGLLEYSRVETQGEPFEPVDLDAVLDEVRDDLQLRIDETDAEIAVDDLPTVAGDASQLRQVFQNLLDNAIEYSGDEPPRIDITAEHAGDRWRIAVTDHGIGIDPDDHDRVFEVFQRLHTNDEHPGTGIGLALCHRIVERHDGEIWVESEPDEGSTFSFTLPAADDGSQ